MSITKIEAESMNLADTYDFTGTVTGAGGGKILQYQSVSTNSTLLSTSTSFVTLTGLTDSITPTATNSKILIICTMAISKQDHNGFYGKMVRQVAGGSETDFGGGTGGVENSIWWSMRDTIYNNAPYTQNYVDTPSYSLGQALTYTAKGKTTSSSYGFGFNRTVDSTASSWNANTFSNMILMELAT